ncbi:MAG TPA: HU family DNA-binding protein [bacterium]|nr:HU family DNA-binding protein [bacterium]
MTVITRQHICEKLSGEFNIEPSEIDNLLKTFFDVFIKTIITGDKIELRNFGVFQLVERKPKLARNLKTNEPIRLPGKKSVLFKPGKEMKDRINKKFNS